MEATNIGAIKISGKILWAVAQFTSKEDNLPDITIIPKEEGIVLMAINGYSAMVAYDKEGECPRLCALEVGASVISACKKSTYLEVTEEGRVWTTTVSKKVTKRVELPPSGVKAKEEVHRGAIDCVHTMLSSPTRVCEENEAHFYGLTHVRTQHAILAVMKEFGIAMHTTKQVLPGSTNRAETALILEPTDAPHLVWINMPAITPKDNPACTSKKDIMIAALKDTLL